MRSDSTRFQIDPTPRRADGEYMAHARISSSRADGSEYDVHASGDLAGFETREDAIAYAQCWAQEWLNVRFGEKLSDNAAASLTDSSFAGS